MNPIPNRIKLWLDDMRPAPDGWFHVFTVDEAIAIMQSHDVQAASLDHDLGACADCFRLVGIDPQDPDRADQWLAMSDYKEMPSCVHFGTGYDFCLWMAEKGTWPATKPTVHSANPVGRERMRGVIDRYFAERTDG